MTQHPHSMANWQPFPNPGEFGYSVATLRKAWPRLHAGDCEPLPKQAGALQAWVHFHNGEFNAAFEQGCTLGGAALHAANRAVCVHAVHLEPDNHRRIRLLQDAAARAKTLQANDPTSPNAWYLEARALGLYSQHISVGLALAEGLGSRVRHALEQTLKLSPKHAEAHLALAAFHAEVIDKVGVLIGGMTYGAKKEAGLHHYRNALALDPHSVTTLLEYANGLRMLEGERARDEVHALLSRAAQTQPLDAWQRLELNAALQAQR